MIAVIDESTTAAAAASSPSSASLARPSVQSPFDNASGDKSNDDNGATNARACAQVSSEARLSVSNNTIPKQESPIIDAVKATNKPPNNLDLMSRLQTFLPQMKSANQELLSSTSSENPFPAPPNGLGITLAGSNPMRLDANLKLDRDSDSDSADDDDDDDEKHPKTNPLIREVGADDLENEDTDETNASGSPNDTNDATTIQLEFTLGNMSGNPLMKLLADDSDEDDDSGCGNSNFGEDTDDPSATVRSKAIANLLQPQTVSKNSTIKSNENNNNTVRLDSITSGSASGGSNQNAGKKRLITELS